MSLMQHFEWIWDLWVLILNDVNLPRSMVNVSQCLGLIGHGGSSRGHWPTTYAGTTLVGKECRRRSELSDSVSDQRALTDGGRIYFLGNACWDFMWLSLLETSTLIIQSVPKSSSGAIWMSCLPKAESNFDSFCAILAFLHLPVES